MPTASRNPRPSQTPDMRTALATSLRERLQQTRDLIAAAASKYDPQSFVALVEVEARLVGELIDLGELVAPNAYAAGVTALKPDDPAIVSLPGRRITPADLPQGG